MGFLGRAIGRRITTAVNDPAQTPAGKAAIERHQHTMAVVQIAQTIAGSGLDDTAACAELRSALPEDREPARDAIEHLGALRTSYIDDRAYRL